MFGAKNQPLFNLFTNALKCMQAKKRILNLGPTKTTLDEKKKNRARTWRKTKCMLQVTFCRRSKIFFLNDFRILTNPN